MDSVSSKHEKGNFRKKRKLGLVVVLGVVIGLILLFVILGFTVFKAKPSVTTVNSINLRGLKVGVNVPKFGIDLNATIDLDISVKNPNKAGFKYGNASTLLYYRGNVVGEAGIPAGEISPGETIGMNLTLSVLAGRLVTNSDVYSDLAAGMLPVSTYTKISGRVSVLRIFKHHMVSYTSCDISINVLNRTIGSSKCKYRSKM